ncbi:LPXTG cell wall anchor domain-containing protein [Vagococcus acidifermentans]|uniref:Gram-positive cocci surface proteins LPxTG domain-containing protein n=1 Tax=Vagococcus acidifermentans TaxID=564710 RepID=A0A430AMH3_9ENTE|nr:LPXTG cell wall anchor domain-containing protein [Vagococcus acidifermentans]RSU09321.1 hypothetical protein CBF27_12975 [Vagococcus acidifermentans]
MLPQTGEIIKNWLPWIGLAIILIVANVAWFFKYRKKK